MNLKQILIQQAFKNEKFSHNMFRSKSNESLRYLCKEKTSFLPEDCPESQRAWHVYHESYEYPRCSGGNKIKSFQTFETGYIKTCHLPRFQCSCWETAIESSRITMKKTNDSGKILNAIQNKYGVNHVSNIPGVKEKISKRKKEFSEDWVKKMQSTMIKRYGVKTTLESSSLRSKYENTMIDRYGSDSVLGSDCLKKKVYDTLISKYGVDNWKRRNQIEILEILESSEFWLSFKTVSEAQIHLKDWMNPATTLNYILRYRPDLIGTGYPISSPHQKIINLLKEHNIEYQINVRHIIPPLELDIYIPSKNLAIEINGVYWHSELQGKSSSYHLNKTLECEKLNIRLLHFWDFEIEDKESLISSMILNRLNLSQKINARQCKIIDVSYQDEKDFLKQNHIQGYTISSYCKGLTYQDELVSLMSFRTSRYNRKFDWEMLRFCTKQNSHVVGGASKLLKHAPFGSIVSYADRRYSQGQLYPQLGFSLIHFSDPSYYYTQDYRKLFHRSSFQKHNLEKKLEFFDPLLTEWENMQLNGFDRVWDCGTAVYGYNPNSCSIKIVN